MNPKVIAMPHKKEDFNNSKTCRKKSSRVERLVERKWINTRKERKIKRRLISSRFAPYDHQIILLSITSPSNPIILYLHSFSSVTNENACDRTNVTPLREVEAPRSYSREANSTIIKRSANPSWLFIRFVMNFALERRVTYYWIT